MASSTISFDKYIISFDQYCVLIKCWSIAEWNLVADLIGLSDEDKDIALRYWSWPKLSRASAERRPVC